MEYLLIILSLFFAVIGFGVGHRIAYLNYKEAQKWGEPCHKCGIRGDINLCYTCHKELEAERQDFLVKR